MPSLMKSQMLTLVALMLLVCQQDALGQDSPRSSRNIHAAGRLLIEGGTSAIAIDQDMARPFAYLATRAVPAGFVALDLGDIAEPRVIAEWHPGEQGRQASHDLATFVHRGRHYLTQAFAESTDGVASQIGAIVFDVTELPGISEAARISAPGGYRALFAYRHSSGRSLMLATGGGTLDIFDIANMLQGGSEPLVRLETPEQPQTAESGFDNVFAGFDPESRQDRLYAAGGGGYYFYDFSDLSDMRQLTSISSAAVQRGRAVMPTPDGRYVLTLAEYRTAPVRIFDLQPGLDGTLPRVRTAVSAWTSNWQNEYADLELRWPLAFAAALEDGLQVINVYDPLSPYTDAYYRTAANPEQQQSPLLQQRRGTNAVDVRNADGLIVVSDIESGFWAFTLEAFTGWHGHWWGVPNMSSVQDWESGPDGL